MWRRRCTLVVIIEIVVVVVVVVTVADTVTTAATTTSDIYIPAQDRLCHRIDVDVSIKVAKGPEHCCTIVSPDDG
jgi:hypothetical protein